MNTSVNAQKVKGSTKLRSNSSLGSAPSPLQTTSPAATRSSHYSTGVAPGFTAPVQTKAAQLQLEPEKKEENSEEGNPVQMLCAECEAEQTEQHEETGETVQSQIDDDELDSPVQAKCSECAEEEEQNTVQQAVIQMWSCDDYPEPTCSIQTKEDNAGLAMPDEQEPENEGEAIVQNKCTACESETPTSDAESVQNKMVQAGSENNRHSNKSRKSSVLRQASEGLNNAHSSLPYKERIQSAFGRHDISGVRTEVGGSAARASERMGALAYASGDKIGFRRTPSLHLAAHEAAHTVQQRAGLKLPGNMGKPGDPWERHADLVADAVVAGESAEPLLDSVVPTSASPPNHNKFAATNDQSGVNAVNSAHANGNGIAPQVQGRITAGSAHQVEPELAEEEAAAASGGGGAGAESAGGASGAEGSGEPEAVEETAEAAEENESDPAADCALAEGEEGAEAEAEATVGEAGGGAESGEAEAAPGGASQKGRCYSATAEDPPEGAEEPANDSGPNESEAQAEVTYGAWEEADDTCECAAADVMAQETGGEGSGESLISSELAEPGAAETLMSGGGETGVDGEVASGEEIAASEGVESESSGGSGGGSVGGADAEPADFSQNEATRDTAVAELDAATVEVAGVPGQTLNLSRGLEFRGAAPGSAAQEAARAMALSQIRSFMLNASNQIQGAVSFVSTDVPARLGGMANSIIAGIDASMAEQKSAISARIAGARIAAIGEAASAREAIQGEYSTNVEVVNTETDAAIEYLNSVYTSSTTDLALIEDEALGEVNQRFADGRTQHEEAGQAYADRAIATGQDWVSSFDHCRSGSGNENKYNGDDGFWDGCLTVRRAHAQQKAACSTASGFAKNMIDAGKKKGFELRQQRTQYRCMLIAGAGQAQSTLDTTIERLVSGLESGRGGTLSGLAQVRDMNLSGVDAALAGTLGSLNRQERQQRQAVNDSGYIQQLAVEELAHQVAAGLARSVSSAMKTLEQTLQQLREQLLEGDAPSPDMLQQALLSAEEGLSGGIGTLLDKMEEGAANAELQLIEAGANAASSLADITSGNDSMTAEAESGFSGQMSTLVGAASNAMSQLSERQVSQAQESSVQGGDTMEQVVSGFEGSCQDIYTGVDGVITTSLSELDTELKGMEDGLEAKIAAEAWRAASKEQPAWKGVVAIVLIVLVIIVSIVVTVLTAGAAGPVALVLIGAIVGGITAGLIQVINNWAAGEEWDKGLVQAIIIGAVGGALGGAIGAGANGLAQAALQGAVRAGASTLTRAAINVGINLAGDLVAEAATQTFTYFAYGQKFNWQGFVMAGGMSVLSTARGGIAGSAGPHGATPRADVDVPTGPSRSAASYATDATIGMGFALGIEGVNVLAGGEFDLNRFATSAAGAGGASRASALGSASGGGRRGADTGTSAPTPRPASGDTPSAPATPRPHGESSTTTPGPRPAGDAETPTPRSPSEVPEGPRSRPGTGDAESATSSRPRDTDAEGAGPRRPESDEGEGAPRRPESEAEGPNTPRQDEVDLNRPAKELSDQELTDATKTTARLGEQDHDFYVNREGCGVCSACGPTKRKINEMLADPNLPPGGLRRQLEVLKAKVENVEARLADGESGVQMVKDSADIAASFRRLSEEHPSIHRSLEEPSIHQRTGSDGEVEVPAHLRDLDADVVRTEVVDVKNFRRSSIKRGEDAVYILRDPQSGAILKVGIAETGPGRFSKYLTAANNLGLNLQLEIAVVNPRGGRSLREVETQLRTRIEGEGHVLPWDNGGPGLQRLGRGGQGTPFVRKSRSPFAWTTDGRQIQIPETIAQLRAQGKNQAEITTILEGQLTATPRTIGRWFSRFQSQIAEAEQNIANARDTTDG